MRFSSGEGLHRGRVEGGRRIQEGIRGGPDLGRTTSDDERYAYGFYWWIVPELNAFTFWGHGGRFTLIVPDRDLLIVLTSLPSADDDVVGTSLTDFLDIARPIVNAAR